MSRSSYSKPSVPNQGSPATPNVSQPREGGMPVNRVQPNKTTPMKDHHEGTHTPGIGAGKPAARTDQGRNKPKGA